MMCIPKIELKSTGRQISLKLLLLSFFILSLSAKAAEKPNILLFYIDDWAWNGSPVAMDDQMPNSRMPVIQMPNCPASFRSPQLRFC